MGGLAGGPGLSMQWWQKAIHLNNIEHGWWEEGVERNFGETIALIHSELSEALESWRKDEPQVFVVDGKPEGWGIEVADAAIRILDLCEANDLDLEEMIALKHEYNKTRPYRHGGLRA